MYKLHWTDTHSYAQYSRKTPACRHIHFSTSSLILSSKLYKVQQEVANSGYICLGTSLPFPTYKSFINIIYQTLCNPFLSWIACCFYPWVVSMLVILPAIIKFIIKHLYYLGILLERSPNNKILVNSNTWLIISPFFHELFSKLLLLLTFLCITLKIILQTKKKNHRLHPYLKIYKELLPFTFWTIINAMLAQLLPFWDKIKFEPSGTLRTSCVLALESVYTSSVTLKQFSPSLTYKQGEGSRASYSNSKADS